MKVIKKEHIMGESFGMKCGSAEAESRKYKKIVTEKRTWYVAIQENEGDNVYVCYTDPKLNEDSEGFAGRYIHFPLEDGTVDEVKGPWHSNVVSLFADTCYDARDKHYTKGIVAEDFENIGTWPNHQYKFFNVYHLDEDYTLGSYNRIKRIAQKIANEKNRRIVYKMESMGGGVRSWCDPENKEDKKD